jgi:CheY-like chemotaxis protein
MASPILLVDDNQELLKLLVQLFEDAGHQVISAARGKQAIDVCRTQPPAWRSWMSSCPT